MQYGIIRMGLSNSFKAPRHSPESTRDRKDLQPTERKEQKGNVYMRPPCSRVRLYVHSELKDLLTFERQIFLGSCILYKYILYL